MDQADHGRSGGSNKLNRHKPPQSGNQQYWNTNLDPKNLGGKNSLSEELAFADAPDWIWATRGILKADCGSEPQETKQFVLDLGAGLGVQALWLARKQKTVLAADLSLKRLQFMARNLDCYPEEAIRIYRVCCRGEALPFRHAALAGVVTRAVLIHTDLEPTLKELRRTLKPGGHYAFTEPTQYNPLVRLYRRFLAPPQWKGITRYFEGPGGREVRLIESHLGPGLVRRWYGLGFLAFVFQFAFPHPGLWKVGLKITGFFDALLNRIIPRGFGLGFWFLGIRGQVSHENPKWSSPDRAEN